MSQLCLPGKFSRILISFAIYFRVHVFLNLRSYPVLASVASKQYYPIKLLQSEIPGYLLTDDINTAN